jgi:hypothetical protein
MSHLSTWFQLWQSASWYVQFNALEGLLWMAVAVIVAVRTPVASVQQRWAARCGVFGFALFGASDWLECRHEAHIPLWLWAMKIASGGVIFAARYTWLGWDRFRCRDREVLFGVFCLICVVALIWFQRRVG